MCAGAPLAGLVADCDELDRFRRSSDNLYHRVRALFFLYAIHRFHVPRHTAAGAGIIPFPAYHNLLRRRFQEAIDTLLAAQTAQGPSAPLSSALAAAYHALGFQTLADQVRRSVRRSAATSGCSASAIRRLALRLDPELLQRDRERRGVPGPARSARPCAWISRTAAGATSSFSGWIFPKARASSTSRSTSPCGATTRRRGRRSRRTSA